MKNSINVYSIAPLMGRLLLLALILSLTACVPFFPRIDPVLYVYYKKVEPRNITGRELLKLKKTDKLYFVTYGPNYDSIERELIHKNGLTGKIFELDMNDSTPIEPDTVFRITGKTYVRYPSIFGRMIGSSRTWYYYEIEVNNHLYLLTMEL